MFLNTTCADNRDSPLVQKALRVGHAILHTQFAANVLVVLVQCACHQSYGTFRTISHLKVLYRDFNKEEYAASEHVIEAEDRN